MNESDPGVRDASAEALGTLMRLLGDKIVTPHLADVDALKMAKIKECSDKAVIVVKVAPAAKARPVTAPSTVGSSKLVAKEKEQTKPVTRPATAAAKKSAPVKKPANAGAINRITKSASTTKIGPTDREMSPEEIDERAADLLPANMLAELGDSNWKSRFSACENFLTALNGLESCPQISQILIRTVCKKPGLKVIFFCSLIMY